MFLRVILVFIGVALFGVVVYLGYQTVSNPELVPWFGVASAVLTPIGLRLISTALSSAHRLAMRRLAKVPEIEELIDKAVTQEEKLKALQAERAALLRVVEYEARTRALETRRATLLRDAAEIVADIDDAESALAALNKEIVQSDLSEDVESLRERVRAQGRDVLIVNVAGVPLSLPRASLIGSPFSFFTGMVDALLTILARASRSKRKGG